MALTRPFPIDKAAPNASDLRKQGSAIYPKEGVFPDPTTLAASGIAYADGGWNISARPFVANLKRGGAPFSQGYGSAQISNDAASPAWAITAAPASGTRVDRLWVKALDPTQGDALDASTPPRAVPQYGVTTGTPTIQPLPAGCYEIAQVATPSTATSSAQSVITQTYGFAYVLGGVAYFRTKADLDAWTNAPESQLASVLSTGLNYQRQGGIWKNSATGLVLLRTVSFTGVGAAAVDGVFTPEFDNYRIVARLSGFTTTEVGARLRASGADDAGALYDSTLHYGYTSTSSAVPYVGITVWQLLASITGGFAQMTIDLSGPALATPTLIDSSHSAYNSGTGLTIKGGSGGGHRSAVPFDGFALIKPSGLMSGVFSVYGYND